MKHARALLATGNVLSSNWTAPVLKGVVQEGSISYRAGLVIKNPKDMENLCGCRASQGWGTICAHSVAVGLHCLSQAAANVPPAQAGRKSTQPGAGGSLTTKQASHRLQRSSDSGEPAELFIILPPNFETAVARGKIMLCLEGKWRSGRSPLNALPKSQPFYFSAQDSALLDQLESLAGNDTPAMLMLDTNEFAALLPLLIDHARMTLGKSSSVSVHREPWSPSLKAALLPSGEIELSLAAARGQAPASAMPVVIDGEWVFSNHSFQPLGLAKPYLPVLQKPLRLGRAQVPGFLMHDWPALQATSSVEANFRAEDFTLEPHPPRFLLELKGGLAQLHALLQCAYGPRIMTVGFTNPNEGLWLPDPDSPLRYGTRDVGAERAALGRLQRAGFTGPDSEGRCQLRGQNAVLNFFAREFPRLQREWEVTIEERLERSTAQNLERIEPRFEVTSSGVQWFDLDLSFSSKTGERFSAAEIQRLVLSGQSHTRLRNGKIAILDTGAVEELQEVLLDCAPQQHANGYRLNQTQAGFLEATVRQQPGWQVKAPAAWKERARLQSGEAKLECPPLGELAWRGSIFFARTILAASWPTRWAWGRRSKHLR